MHKKNKRILWLLNHRTLMPYEAPLIRRLGFEIYVPKVIPKSNTGFRSGAIDFCYDSSLSLPTGALKELNGFNFYEEVWPAKIVTIVNRYFGTAFVMPHARQVAEAVEKFEGQIVFRAFGLPNSRSYRKVLDDLYGPLVLRKIYGIKTRFWFGEGYDNLHECDDPIFSERALFLPIGVPDSFFANAGQWTGSVRKILFVCPHVASNPYYVEIYRRFKKDFGHFPHIIVGEQDVPVSDPHVLGFVSDEELKRLYLECAVLYYPSTEQRHVHYSPIEAAISGMPIVFFESSLLARLSKGAMNGRVASVREAQQVIERILDNDVELISQIKSDQKDIAFHFSDEYCAAVWKRELDARGFMRALEQQSRANTTWREVKRALLMPFAHGRISIDPHRRAVQPAAVTLTASDAESRFGCSLYGGIRFSEPEFPEFVDYVSSVSGAEPWGRWSTGETILIVLKHNLAGQFRLLLRAVGFGRNAGIPIPVRIGGQARTVQLPLGIEEAKGAWLHFNLETPCNVIEVKVPHPTRPEMDGRTIGIGMIEIGAAPWVTMSAAQAKQVLASSLADGIDFRAPDFPIFVERVQGLSTNETWGRWSDGQRVLLELKHTLSGRFRLLVRAVGYGPNIGVPVSVTIGRQTRTVKLPAQIGPEDELTLDFDLREPANIIEITVPHPIQPLGDARAVGIGFLNLRMGSATLGGTDTGAASMSVQAAKNAVRERAKLVYRGAKPFLRPIASRARRYLLASAHQDLELLRLQLVHELAQQSERIRYDMQTMVREFAQQSERTRQDIVRELVKDNEWLPSHLDRIERYAIASAKRVAIPCGNDDILVRTEVGYVLCLASDHAVLACLIESGELERGTRLALQSLLGSGDVFVDVGANLGLHTLAAARAMRGQGKIIAFEPFQPTADLLRQSVWMNGFSSLVEIHQTAVSNRSGQERLYLGRTSGHHSLYPLSPTETHGPPVEVALTRLDDVIGANSTVTLVKIDAEGAELDILEGARLLIERTHEIALIVEFGPSHLKRTGCSTKDWFLSFERFGLQYEVIDADTGALEFWPIDRLETVESVNLLFARPEAAVWRKAEALRRKA